MINIKHLNPFKYIRFISNPSSVENTSLYVNGSDELIYKNSSGVDSNLSSGGGSNKYDYWKFSLSGQANSTIGRLAKASDAGSTSNPSGKPTTEPSNSGLRNGGPSPYVAFDNGTITKIVGHIARGATGVGSVAGSVSIRLQLYQVNTNSRTLIQTIDCPLTIVSGSIGTFNNLGGDGYATFELSLNISVNSLSSYGLQFTNVGGNNAFLNSVSRLEAVMEVEY